MTPRARQRRTRRRIRNAAGLLSLVAFLALLGSVGAVEQDLVPLLPGAIRIYDNLVEANEIFPIMDDQDKADRLKLQRAALTECKKLLHMIQLSKDRGYIDSGTFDYWTKLTVDVKCMTARWYDAERKTGIPVEPAGPIPEG